MNQVVKFDTQIMQNEVEFSIVQKLIEEHQIAKQAMIGIYENLEKIKLDSYQIIEALTYKAYSSAFHTLDKALKKISDQYWRKLEELLKLEHFISRKEHEELLSKIAKGEIQEFNYENVNQFLTQIWSTRHFAYARKIDSLFSGLNRDYKANLGAGINPYIIIQKEKYYSSFNRDKAIYEVRFIARQLFGLSIDFNADINSIYHYDWHSIDHNLLKVKFYSNGNCHIWFNQCLIERINSILNILYPDQIGTGKYKHKRRAFDEPIDSL